MNLNIRTVE